MSLGAICVTPANTLSPFELDSGHEVVAAHIRWDTVRDTVGEASGSGLSDLGPPHRGILFDRRARDLAGMLWARAGRRIRRGGSTPMA
jgi:hypothetical protein